MQSVSSAWTAETIDSVRKIAHNLQISWKKDSLLLNRTFTIGVSLIGGNDAIGANPGAIGSPANYRYFDESSYVESLGWERSLNMPLGGITKALGEATLENTTGRFTPRYMGGNSELFTAILPRRPSIISAGFNFNGIDQTIPLLSGIVTKNPEVSIRDKSLKLEMADFIDFFSDRYVDRSTTFTAQTTDTVIESLFSQLGMSTAQYNLDPGINIIPFGSIDKGSSFSNVIQKLVQAENGHLFQDELGIIRFQNRQHWDSSPFNTVQRIIRTYQVIDAEAPSDDHLINVVEIKAKGRSKAILQKVWALASPQIIPAGGTLEIFADFSDEDGTLPMLSVATPTFVDGGSSTSAYYTNLSSDSTGATNSASISVKTYYKFTTAYKIVFQNVSIYDTYLISLDLWGRPAKVTSEIYTRKKRDASMTAYEERPLIIDDNEFIQSQEWADSFAEILLDDFSEIENLQRITIMAIPELQLGDLISWQGRYWRIYGIKGTIDAEAGFIQELSILQRTIRSYFRVGISLIGGSDMISA